MDINIDHFRKLNLSDSEIELLVKSPFKKVLLGFMFDELNKITNPEKLSDEECRVIVSKFFTIAQLLSKQKKQEQQQPQSKII